MQTFFRLQTSTEKQATRAPPPLSPRSVLHAVNRLNDYSGFPVTLRDQRRCQKHFRSKTLIYYNNLQVNSDTKRRQQEQERGCSCIFWSVHNGKADLGNKRQGNVSLLRIKRLYLRTAVWRLVAVVIYVHPSLRLS